MLILCARSSAQDNSLSPLPLLQGRPDEINPEALVGPIFSDPLQGIALRPPADAQTVRQNLSPSDIAEFINEKSSWVLKVSRAQLPKPIPLASDPRATPPQIGLLELTAQQFKAANPSAQILRDEIQHLPIAECGILVANYSQSNQPRLMQQAIIRMDDQVYYVLTMTSPQGDSERAKRTFDAVIKTVQLIDRTKIKEDQDQRLLRTRAFYNHLTAKKILAALPTEQCQLITQGGKNIGYRYIVGQTEKRFGRDGMRIGIRSHIETAAGTVDSQAWLTCSLDRVEEEWSSGIMTLNDKGAKNSFSELGTSTQYSRDVFDPIHGVADPNDPGQPRVRTEKHYELRVTRITLHGTQQPIQRDLPPFYVPQALGFILPALLAREEAKTYMFATWSDEEQQVITRYLDVRPLQSMELSGKTMQVTPVEDRLGLEGAITIHYIDTAGHEIATRAAGGVFSCDTVRASVLAVWKNANLTPPG